MQRLVSVDWDLSALFEMLKLIIRPNLVALLRIWSNRRTPENDMIEMTTNYSMVPNCHVDCSTK